MRQAGEGVTQGKARRTGKSDHEQPESRDEALERGRNILLVQLTAQSRSRAELAKALRKKDIPEDVAAELLDRFEEVSLVDDEAFSQAWVASRQRRKHRSRRMLMQELRNKGVDPEVAKEAVDEVDDDAEYAAALDLARSRVQRAGDVPAEKLRTRVAGLLARRGYSSSIVWRAVAEVMESDDELDGTGPDW
ncbi:hypothetical protein CGZ91_07360 [Parenemella sanctibonifatiensis]|uniref:Regulatory protein RecX n=1 Tax=Parenemella sanctibonifatiensis TaxID=2016505 RepID=A0A255EIA3_9ACTN|nr:hypothetical protein CGZ91_07360 [Parenemella sanctibonifatiensis]